MESEDKKKWTYEPAPQSSSSLQIIIIYTNYKGWISQNHMLTCPSKENSVGILFNSTQYNPCQNLKISWFPAGLIVMTELVDSKPLISV